MKFLLDTPSGNYSGFSVYLESWRQVHVACLDSIRHNFRILLEMEILAKVRILQSTELILALTPYNGLKLSEGASLIL